MQAVPLLAQFQGSLLLLERMSRTGTIPASGIDGLVSSLCMLETTSGRYDGALAAWIETTLLPALPPPPGDSNRPLETSLLRALADTAEASPPFEWEGAKYITDVTAASFRDLIAIRAKQGGNSVDAVMVYAQPGHGRRALLHTDYTFALRDGDALVPFAKAYSGLTDAEIRTLDAWIRRHTIDRFASKQFRLARGQVFELHFEGIQRSPRHKSGVAVRFPRIARWRTDKTADEADTIETLRAMIEAPV